MVNRQHPNLHPNWIDSHANGIVKALQKSNFETYLVGGCVRDLLLGIHPKDFDIATTAKPEEIRKVIYKAYVIGKRFRLVLVKRDDQQYEVATFRKNIEDKTEDDEEASPEGDNVFGTPEEDAMRRDFTINGLFYDPVGDKLIDHPGGLEDLENGFIRMIGEPNARLVEDPIRILRALRLSHKVHFSIEPSLRAAMQAKGETLLATALPRRREEILKLLKLRDPAMAFVEAYDLGVLKFLCPTLNSTFEDPDKLSGLLHNLSNMRTIWLDSGSPLELFGHLVLYYLLAEKIFDPNQPIKANDILEHPKVSLLMKEELGMFKYEQAIVAKAIHMQSVLQKRIDFERKGHRRQMAVLKNEAFPLALKYAIENQTLDGSDLNFWLKSYWDAMPAIEDLRREESKKRRSTSRRRRRKPAPKS